MANRDRLHLKAKKTVDTTPAAAHEVKGDAKGAANRTNEGAGTGGHKASSHTKSNSHQATSKKR